MKKISSKKPVRPRKKSSVAGPATAPQESAPDISTPAERKKALQLEIKKYNAERRQRFEELAAQQEAKAVSEPESNPLFRLSEEQRSKLFVQLRDCPYDDAVRHMLKDGKIADVTRQQLQEFFEQEAESHWEKRIERAATEANALVRLAEKNQGQFSSGILAALGQEAFRQIAIGEAQPESMNKIATLFLKVRGDLRAEQALKLRRKKLKHDWRNQTNRTLDAFSEDVDKYPGVREAFEALKKELLNNMEEAA